MFRFEDPQYFWLLAVVALLFVVRFVSDRLRMRRLRRFGDAELVKSLMPDVSARRSYVKFGLLAGALALVVVMLARPQMGAKVSTENRNGIEAIICIDISNSMLARDVVPSRLDKTKMLVENMVDNFTNDKIGLVVFAGDAFVQLPITSDYVSAKHQSVTHLCAGHRHSPRHKPCGKQLHTAEECGSRNNPCHRWRRP